jgi:hypothetical protein
VTNFLLEKKLLVHFTNMLSQDFHQVTQNLKNEITLMPCLTVHASMQPQSSGAGA